MMMEIFFTSNGKCCMLSEVETNELITNSFWNEKLESLLMISST
jgi:hypothetical protein